MCRRVYRCSMPFRPVAYGCVAGWVLRSVCGIFLRVVGLFVGCFLAMRSGSTGTRVPTPDSVWEVRVKKAAK